VLLPVIIPPLIEHERAQRGQGVAGLGAPLHTPLTTPPDASPSSGLRDALLAEALAPWRSRRWAMERCTVVLAILLFSLSTAPRMRSAPHSRLAAAISVIRMMVSGATLGLVEGATARDRPSPPEEPKGPTAPAQQGRGLHDQQGLPPDPHAADQQDH